MPSRELLSSWSRLWRSPMPTLSFYFSLSFALWDGDEEENASVQAEKRNSLLVYPGLGGDCGHRCCFDDDDEQWIKAKEKKGANEAAALLVGVRSCTRASVCVMESERALEVVRKRSA